ncbi:ankyrin repeat and BTB/POZ domain-containing protein 1-like [Sinocyclocheilus grahami]|uniref:ankyrin repeat and BTB/POZ domain-containing protein 1-like n=1 Tax=Sinocyclocheilus grahami TaxID=75366 RepID=UPI0007ACC395|nr:PREDICTED: ankyrin repeat and BTB/POZ domain-containing protein 1-like [Sinocyclocheilus grahami]
MTGRQVVFPENSATDTLTGAKCEANTFDGERCLYGALSDPIRRLLKEYKRITAKAMQRDYYDQFLQTLLEQGSYSDVTFMVHGEMFKAHRCILSARSEYFAHMLETKWKGKSAITLKHPLVNPAAFGAIMQYFYTGRLDIDVNYVEDCKRLAKQCKISELIEELEVKCKQVYEFGEEAVGYGQLPFDLTDSFPSYPDICFRVEGYDFLCHKAFFCGRSDYFKALLEDHFSEGETLQAHPSIPVITLHDVSHDLFSRILYYIYSDNTQLSHENVYEVLCVADMYLLPGLKRLCGRTLAVLLNEENVLHMWKTAKLFRLSRLEDQCTEYMAKIIERLVERPEFADMIREDAGNVAARQETDSIPLVDEIRFHIASNVQTYSAIEEANQKLSALELLLASIGLEC